MSGMDAEQHERETVIRWRDPGLGLAARPSLTGLEYLRKIASGELPAAPMASHINARIVDVGEGTATFECWPDESHYNPIGFVHGGLVCTLLDSALGCAAQTLLPAGTGYTSIEIKVNYLRPVHSHSGPLIATGRVTKPGRRVSFTEGEVRDNEGKIVATAQSTLLVFPLEAE